MPFYQRAFLYLIRKRTKSVLLLLIFLVVNSMILGTNIILRAAENAGTAMQEKTKAKVICEAVDAGKLITDKEAAGIQSLGNVTFVNRMGQCSAYAADLTPVTDRSSTDPDNQKVALRSFDDLDTEGPFAEQSCRLTEGRLIGRKDRYSAVVHAGFAKANGLETGAEISFETEEGKSVAVRIIGEYLTGKESLQEKSVPALSRVENQIYIDNTAYEALSGESGYYKISLYTSRPELLGTLEGEIQGILQDKAEITASDDLYRQIKAPLTQMTRVMGLMRLLALFTGMGVVSLLLCMWMRNRQKEMAVFLSMGERKLTVFLQVLLETALLFLAAAIGSCGLGTLAAGQMRNLLLASVETEIFLEVSLRPGDIVRLLGAGGGAAMAAVLISLLPLLRANPKEILSRMEG